LKATIVSQRQELVELLDSGVLREFAEDYLERAHGHAVEQAAAETGIPDAQFPTECPYLLVELLGPGLVRGTQAFVNLPNLPVLP
jgi:hypothetical protein